jgi:hypothetical protein
MARAPLHPLQSLQLRQLTQATETRFVPGVHKRGRGDAPPDQDQLRSRGFAAMAARLVSGITDVEAAKRVTDYYNDDGIDGFAITGGDSPTPTVYLVQAKWSANGSHSFGVAETRELVAGFEKLLRDDLHKDNLLHDHLPEIVLQRDKPGVRFVLVFASSGVNPVSPRTEAETWQELKQHIKEDIEISYQFLSLADFAGEVRTGLGRGRGVSVSGRLQWRKPVEEDHLSLQGTISAAVLGEWYLTHDRRLFDDNVRVAMESDVNDEIVRCLLEEPHNFWYFHVGVTALCESWRRAGKDIGPVPHDFFGLRIVNGAQTVHSIGRAMKVNQAAVEQAQVPIRFIRLDHAPPGFGAQVARATNRSNPMSARDLVAMDHVQQRLRDEFELTWSRNYAIRAGDPVPTQANGCSVQEAAIAMACGRYGATALMKVTGDTASLWATQGSAYRELFDEDVTAVEVWRRVQTLRRITEELDQVTEATTERGKSVAVLGRLIIAHTVMRHLGDNRINDIASEWENGWSRVPELTVRSFLMLTETISSHLAAGKSEKDNIKGVASCLEDGKWFSRQIGRLLTQDVTPLTQRDAHEPASWRSAQEFRMEVKYRLAVGRPCDGGFLVHAGSPAAVKESKSLGSTNDHVRQNLHDSLGLEAHGDLLRLTRDTLFTSRTQAAAVLLGHMVSGPGHWKPSP